MFGALSKLTSPGEDGPTPPPPPPAPVGRPGPLLELPPGPLEEFDAVGRALAKTGWVLVGTWGSERFTVAGAAGAFGWGFMKKHMQKTTNNRKTALPPKIISFWFFISA